MNIKLLQSAFLSVLIADFSKRNAFKKKEELVTEVNRNFQRIEL